MSPVNTANENGSFSEPKFGTMNAAANSAADKLIARPDRDLAQGRDSFRFIASILHPLESLVKPEAGAAMLLLSGPLIGLYFLGALISYKR